MPFIKLGGGVSPPPDDPVDAAKSEAQPRPRIVYLAQEARPAWEALMRRLIAMQRDPDTPQEIKGVLSKLKVYAARFALIIHQLNRAHGIGDEDELTADSVQKASLLVEYFLSHARKTYAFMASDGMVKDCKRLLG